MSSQHYCHSLLWEFMRILNQMNILICPLCLLKITHYQIN